MSRISPQNNNNNHQRVLAPELTTSNPYSNARNYGQPSSSDRDVTDFAVSRMSGTSPPPHGGAPSSYQQHVVLPIVQSDISGHDSRLPPARDVDVVEDFQQATTRSFISLRTLIEAIAILCAMIPIAVAPHLDAYQRGFNCNDPNLIYPFREGTVKPWLLYLFCLVLPAVVVIVGEVCRFYVSKSGYATLEVPYRLWKNGPRVPPVVVSYFRIVVLFTYGFLITKSVTDISKYAVGRLRPHFLDVCKPDLSLFMGSGGCANKYITQFDCSTANSTDPKVQYRLRDSRLSFLSGHASMAFYSMFFLIFYLESRLRWNQLRYCKAIIQFGLFLLAALTGMSRISDHKHHWTDVFAGALLGMVVVMITVFFVGDFFNDSHFLRFKLVSMLQKLDWGNDEGSQFARLLSTSNGKDPRVLQKLKHVARYQNQKTY